MSSILRGSRGMTETTHSTPLTTTTHAALMFPTLSAAQIARIAPRGVIRPITRGEVLIEGGQTNVPFFVVKAGEIEVIRPSGLGDLLIAVVHADRFTGDISMILGRPALMRLRVSESGEVVQLTRDQMHALIQTDAEMSEVLMTALLYRRIELVAQGIGDVLLIGSAQSAASCRAFKVASNDLEVRFQILVGVIAHQPCILWARLGRHSTGRLHDRISSL